MPNSVKPAPRKGQPYGPWSLILFVAFIGSALVTMGLIRLVAGLLH